MPQNAKHDRYSSFLKRDSPVQRCYMHCTLVLVWRPKAAESKSDH